MSNYISYASLIKDRNNFRMAAGKHSSEFNLFDTPGQKYFKIFFYFNNGDFTGDPNMEAGNGLITPTWLVPEINDNTYYMHNSAWSYLKMNNEDERADLLRDFVNLLSNISSESPWYFSEISGLDSAMDRKAINTENFTIEATRPKISIKCLPDSFDDRIGTLLDLYRAIAWSWVHKREILPSNLRKFDMGILIFETPNEPFHKLKSHTKSFAKSFTSFSNAKDALLGDGVEHAEYSVVGMGQTNDYVTSYKYIELHNCEIDYNSSKNLYSTLNNKDGMQVEYTIDIHFDDCYETRYNEFSMKSMGDLIEYDLLDGLSAGDYIYPETQSLDNGTNSNTGKELSTWEKVKAKASEIKDSTIKSIKSAKSKFDTSATTTGLENRINVYDKGFLDNAIDQIASTGVNMASSLIKKAVLGNLYTFSLSKIQDQVKGLVSGDVLGTAGHVVEYLDNAKSKDKTKGNGIQNKKLFKKKIQPKVTYIGKLAQGNTIANNI